MPNADTAAPIDPALMSAYDRYATVARQHDLIRADPRSTATQRLDAAMAVHKAFQDFLTTNAKPTANGE